MDCERAKVKWAYNTQLTVDIVWVTKYRYLVPTEYQKKCQQLIIQICDAEDIRILKGAVSKDYVHIYGVSCLTAREQYSEAFKKTSFT